MGFSTSWAGVRAGYLRAPQRSAFREYKSLREWKRKGSGLALQPRLKGRQDPKWELGPRTHGSQPCNLSYGYCQR